MKDSEIAYKVQQKLADFDEIGPIKPSEAWRNSLMRRFVNSKHSSRAGITSARILIPIILIVLLNLGFILNTVIRNNVKTDLNSSDLQVISEQLLINPTSLSN